MKWLVLTNHLGIKMLFDLGIETLNKLAKLSRKILKQKVELESTLHVN